MRRITIIILFFLFTANCFAQDPHFSQFFSSPLTLNPALTGKFDGDLRITGDYRNQWPSINRAFITTTASIDFPILRNAIGDNDRWGLGIMAYSDKSANGALNVNYLSLSTAYHKGLDEDGFSQISLGFQGTYSNMMLNTSNLKFEDQLTPFGFTGTTGEVFSGNTLKNSYYDLNAGILYSKSTNETNNFYVGASFYHILRPKQSFTGTYFLLNQRATVHAGGFFPVGQTTTLHLSGLYSSQAKAHETVLGGAMQLAVSEGDNPTNVYVGSWIRISDAIIPYIGLEFGGFRLGLTYDVTTSSLKTASESKGGIELSLNYTKRPADSKGVPCPKF